VISSEVPPAPPAPPYPVRVDADYPERQSRWKALFRLILVIPALLFSLLAIDLAALGLLVMWTAILVRGRIPRWLFDLEVGANRFFLRTQAYLSLLTDVYPAWDGAYPISYGVDYPARVSRWQVVIWKLATSIPHLIVIFVLQYAAYAVTAVAWLAILFSGQFPKALHEFVVGVMRWRERVYAYALSLTDEFPPYSLAADAPAATGTARTASAAVGAVAVAGMVAGIVACAVFVPWTGETKEVEVSYARVTGAGLAPGEASITISAIQIDLVSALDPADDTLTLYPPRPGHRLVLFRLFVTGQRGDFDDAAYFFGDDFQLNTGGDDDIDALLAVAGRRAPPVELPPGDTMPVEVVFEVPVGLDPAELTFREGGFLSDTGIFRFR
jgi:hypothetical protein